MSNNAPRLVFAGTPEFAASHLGVMIAANLKPAAVYTQPDRPAGRGRALSPSPVKALALQHDLPICQPASLRTDQAQAELAALAPDLLVVVAYGLILPQEVLDIPRYGCINVHASLLPRWRGAAPIQRAIQAGDPRSGITIMQMDAGLDTGAMLATAECPIEDTDTAASLHDKLQQLGGPLLLSVLRELPACLAAATPQPDSGASYAKKISKDEAEIDWQRSANALLLDIRAFNPFPVSFSWLGEQRVKIHQASRVRGPATAAPGTITHADDNGIVVACGDGALSLQRLQLPGGKALPVAELLRARSDLLQVGTRLGAP